MNTSSTSLSQAPVSKALEWIKEGISFYFQNFGLLVIATGIAMILGIFSFTLLLGPLLAGVLAIVLRLQAGDSSVAVSDIFSQFNKFIDTFLCVLALIAVSVIGQAILGNIPGIGWIISNAFQLCVQSAFAFSLLLIVDRNLGVAAALKDSYAIFMQNPGAILLVSLLASLISGLGALLFGIGVFFTAPVYPVVLAYVYATEIRGTGGVHVATSETNIDTEQEINS